MVDIETVVNIAVVCLTIVSAIYEIIAFINRRADDGPASILQFLALVIARIIYFTTGIRLSYYNPRRYNSLYSKRLNNTLTRRSKLTLDRHGSAKNGSGHHLVAIGSSEQFSELAGPSD